MEMTVIDRSNEVAPPVDPSDNGVLKPDPVQQAIDAELAAKGIDPHDCRIPSSKRDDGAAIAAPAAPAPSYGALAPVPSADTAQAHVAARAGILGRRKKLQDRLVSVPPWQFNDDGQEILPIVERTLPDGTVERGNVLVIEATGLARAELLQHALDGDGRVQLKRIYPDMVIACAHHPANRAPLFFASDRDQLLQDSGSALEAVATVAGELSGMDKAAQRRAEGN